MASALGILNPRLRRRLPQFFFLLLWNDFAGFSFKNRRSKSRCLCFAMEDSMGRRTASGIIISKGGCSITFREQKFHDRSIRYCNRIGCCASRYSIKGTQVGKDKTSCRSGSSKSPSSNGFREPILEKRYDEEDVADSSNRQADSSRLKCNSRSLEAKYVDSRGRLGKKEKSSSLRPLVETTKVCHFGKTASREVRSCSVKLSSRASKEVARKPKYQLREDSNTSGNNPMSPLQTEQDMSSRSEDYGLNDLRQTDASDILLSNFNSADSATARVEKDLRRSYRNGSTSSRDNLTSNQILRRSRSQSTIMGVVSVRTRQSPTGNPRVRPLEQVDESNLLPDPVGELGTLPQSALRSSRDGISLFNAFAEDNDGYPHLSVGNVAEVLLELERIEYEGLTYEQLSFLENHLFLDGLINDQYSDMRMDIDDMTYEELLALGEEMGTVSTALSEEALSKCLKKSKYVPTSLIAGISRSDEGDAKCSICQEEWATGEEMGMLVCEHFYHVQCINQWLRLKNWCPICKASVSPTP